MLNKQASSSSAHDSDTAGAGKGNIGGLDDDDDDDAAVDDEEEGINTDEDEDEDDEDVARGEKMVSVHAHDSSRVVINVSKLLVNPKIRKTGGLQRRLM